MARSTSLMLGLTALGMAVVASYGMQAGWQPGACFSSWPRLMGLTLLLPALLAAYWMGERWRARRAHELGITPDRAEEQESSRWVAGFLCNDLANPADIVPKRVGTGHGTTLNIDNPLGKLVSLLFFVFVTAFPLVMMLVAQ